MTENVDPSRRPLRVSTSALVKAEASVSTSSCHLSSDLHSIGRVFGDDSSLVDQSLGGSMARPETNSECDLATAQLRALLVPSSEQLHNAQLEIQRLSRLLEQEVARGRQQKQKLEEDIRVLRLESKMAAQASVISPPSKPGAGVAGALPAVEAAGHYLIGLTGPGTEEAVSVFAQLGAAIVDADAVALQLTAKGAQLYNDLVNEFGPGAILDRQTAELRREGLDARKAAKFDKVSTKIFLKFFKKSTPKMVGAAVASESSRLIAQTRTHVVVYRASRLYEFAAACNCVVFVGASRVAQVAQLAGSGSGLSMAAAVARVAAQSQSAAAARATVVLDAEKLGSAELRSRLVRLWVQLPQPGCEAALAAHAATARLAAVDPSLPACELFEDGEVTFGRGEQCSVQLQDVTVSHAQCRVFCRAGRVWLDDLSTHGTFVNRAKVGHGLRVELAHGDVVHLSKAAVKAKAPPHFVVHLHDHLESRVLQFPPAAPGAATAGSLTPRWIEKRSQSHPEARLLLNVRTGETKLVERK
jgi:dephospho-CoA kinase